MVPSEAAKKIAARDADSLVLLNDPKSAEEEEDTYADHPIPDDLMW